MLYLMITWICLLCISADEIYTGPDVCVIYGEVASLYCNYSTSGNAEVTWYKGDTTATADEIIFVDASGQYPRDGFDRHSILLPATLQINKTEYNDTSLYWCEIDGYRVILMKDSIGLTILEPYRVDMKSAVEESTYDESVEVSITCVYSGRDDSRVTWEKDGEQVTSGNRYIISHDGSILTIPNTTRDDAGNYSCTVTNCAGVRSTSPSELVVYFPATIAEKYNSARSVEFKNSFVTLTVKVHGEPTPNYTWWNEAGLLEDQTTSIITARVNSDYDKITCKTCNNRGCAEEHFELYILRVEEGVFIFLMVLVAVICIGGAGAVVYVCKFKGKSRGKSN